MSPVKKKGNETPAGLHRTKSGKLSFPWKFLGSVELPKGINLYGFPVPVVGDLVASPCPNSVLTAGKVGRLVNASPPPWSTALSGNIHLLDGNMASIRLEYLVKLTPEQVEEVIAYYEDRGGPKRVFFNPLKD